MTEQKENKPEKKEHDIKQKQADQKNHQSSLPIIACLVLSLTAIIATTFSFFYAQKRDQSLNQELTMTNQSISTLVDKQQTTAADIDADKQAMKKEIGGLSAQIEQNKSYLKEMRLNSGQSKPNWTLKKAQFYLQLAQINAHWSQPSQTTIDLLEQADSLLVNQHQPEVYDIRQAIRKEVTDLQNQTDVDIVGLLSQISSIQTQLRSLTYQDQPLLKKSQKQTNNKESETRQWKQYWANSVNALEKLVVIRHHQQPIKPILSDQQFSLVKEGLYVDLQQAKWAVINHNQAVYELALKQAVHEIQYHFNDQSANVNKIVSNLQTLKAAKIQQKSLVPKTGLNLMNELLNENSQPSQEGSSSGGNH